MHMTDVEEKTKLSNSPKRLEWCDIYKGIIILLVVVGHYTSQYNEYIYQFHMAAFFFISGYTTNFRKNTTLELVSKKFYSLMFPYYFFSIIGTFLFYLLFKLGILSYVSNVKFPDSLKEAFRVIFVNEGTYCDWLGALWFVPILFGASVISKVMFNIFGKKLYVMFVSVIVFLIGQYMVRVGGNSKPYDLIYIAQYYVTLGSISKEIICEMDQNKLIKKKPVHLVLIILGLICFLTVGKQYIVDWPARKFNGLIDLINPLCGVVICVAVSMLLQKSRLVKKAFISMGTYSFAIMVFHFLGFKISYLWLILNNKVEINILASLTPNDMVRNSIWWGFGVIISIVTSIFLWKFLMCFAEVRICCGKNSFFVQSFLEGPIVSALRKLYKSALDVLIELKKATIEQFLKFKKYTLYIVGIVVLLIVVNLYAYSCDLTVNFPYNGGQIYFERGWFDQSLDEGYRWVEKSSKTVVILVGQDNVYIHGYIPSNIKNMSQMQVLFNGKEVYSENVHADYEIEVSVDISEFKRIGINNLEIIFDGCRVPEENEADIRGFSALIEKILFY